MAHMSAADGERHITSSSVVCLQYAQSEKWRLRDKKKTIRARRDLDHQVRVRFLQTWRRHRVSLGSQLARMRSMIVQPFLLIS